jgi:valyl-tRNA synthetase
MTETKEESNYDFKEAEKRILEFWNREKIFKFNDTLKKKPFSIDTPPPYISGKMHIGHAFGYSQQDFIARFRRMIGENVFYPFGTDDNGLPTERFIEKTNQIKSSDMARSDFINLCLKTLKDTTAGFVNDWREIGLSADFDLSYSTIDKNAQKISQISFIELYKKGEIYLQEFPTLWCCECQTAIAQAELEDKEQQTLFSTLKFKVDKKDLLIATTRPELLGACVAVFVNPKDPRYTKLIGKNAKVPLFDFEVPIIADESAQIDKGTGVLMVCSYGDKYDAQSITRHKLRPKIILDSKGLFTIEPIKGMKIKVARKKILEDLKNLNLIEEQKSINNIVNVHDKCGSEIEILPTKQWFTKILDKREELISLGKKIKWYPEFMFKRYENWVRGLEWDWNISRNRHFGVPIPAWHCNSCKKIILPEEAELPVDPIQTKKKCPNCKKDAESEKMVLDTWATSSLTPQIGKSLDKKINMPYSLRPQGHDIIRTWAFYTIVKSYLHNKDIPWKEIIISGNVSMGGEKMSKSKGNVIEPRIVLHSYGADALRYWAACSKLGEDLDYQEKDLLSGKKFINKIWNAGKFVFMNLGEDFKKNTPKKLEKIDELFLSELNRVIENCKFNFLNYEYSKVKSEAESFFWHDFCDNYLEIIKYRIYNGKEEEKNSAKYVLYYSLFALTRILAPIIPFIIEEIYQKHFLKYEEEKSVHLCSWPEKIKLSLGIEKEREKWLGAVEIIEIVRKAKSDAKLSVKKEIILTIEKEKLNLLKECLKDIQSVCNAKEIKTGEFNIEFV